MSNPGLPSAPRPRRRPAGLALALALGTALGCSPSAPARDATGEAQRRLDPVSVSDDEFPFAVHRLLREGEPTAERSALLAGVVRRQLSRAATSFREGAAARGTAAVVGALYLLRAGEARPDMFGPEGDRALAGAIQRFSARGDEGRSQALMLMRATLLPPTSTARRELDGHLAALRRWMAETRTGGDMERLAEAMRAAVDRALVDPSEVALRAAAEAVGRWIERAVEYNLEFHRTGRPPPPPEAQEAFRALQTGGATMLALFLRHGRAKLGLDHIEKSSAHRVIPPPLFRLLETTAADDAAADWRTLAQVLAQDAQEDEQLLQLDEQLRDAALWGAALEAYRRDRSSLAIAHILSRLLGIFGMPDVAPLVLADAIGDKPSPVSLSGALAAAGGLLEPELDASTPASARRIFRSAGPLLLLGDRAAYRGRLEPSTAQLRDLMARIEIRFGEVDAALPLMLAALEAEPSVWGYTRLSLLERQMAREQEALAHARRALELPAAKLRVPGAANQLDAAEAELVIFEILRDRQARTEARAALERALGLTTASLADRLPPRTRVRAELLLARILDAFGDRALAARAIHRALEVASRYPSLLGPAMLTAIARALLVGDPPSGRAALQRGIDADLEQDDQIYGALWLMLLEQQSGQPSDGKVARVLDQPWDATTWTGQLARWARGRLDEAGLLAAARSYAERVEAEFYLGLRSRLAGDESGTERVRRVSRNPLIDLMEVQLARDLLAPRFEAPVPERFRVP